VTDRRLTEPPFEKTSTGVAWRGFGAGEPLVLLHGGAGNWQHWVMNVDALAGRFRVIAVDMPCYGDSDAVPRETEIDDYLARVLDAVLEITGDAPRVHLGGFSFGGAVAAAVAVGLGERAASLSMTGGAGYGPPAGRSFVLDSQRRMARRLGREPNAEEVWNTQADNLAKLMIYDQKRIDDWAIAMQVRNVTRTRFDSRRISWMDITPGLVGQLDCPVFILYGEHDAAAIPPVAGRIERCRAVNARVEAEIIPGSGHWVMYETPSEVNRLLADFHGRAG